MTTTVDAQPDAKESANAIIGERVHTHMWREGRTQKQLAALLGVNQGSVSNRLRGKTFWSATEVMIVSAWLNVPVSDLMPEFEITGPINPDDTPPGAVPPPGLEPGTCGLRDRQTTTALRSVGRDLAAVAA